MDVDAAMRAFLAGVCLLLAASVLPVRAATRADALDANGALVFHKADDTPVSKAIFDSFVQPMLKQDPQASPQFLWARYDVDGDGYDELFLAFAGADRCTPDAGCPIVVLRREPKGNWAPVLTGSAASVVLAPDPPRRSSILVMKSKIGERTWVWDDRTASMVERTKAASTR